MALLSPLFLDTVVAIGNGADSAQRQWTGTGFIFGLLKETKGEQKLYQLFLVTNKHVFKGNSAVYIKFNSALDPNSKDYETSLVSRNGKQAWVGHPDPEVDVAALILSPGFLKSEGRQFSYFQSDDHVLYKKSLKELTVTEGDRVFVLGFPMGMVSPERQYVICRGGYVARIRDYLEGKTKDFLIDSPVFPGNSGGPVISCPSALAIQGTQMVSVSALIGIVKSYVPYREFAISPQTGMPRMLFEENSGLTAVESADSIYETVKLASKRIQMRAAFAKYRAKKAAIAPGSPQLGLGFHFRGMPPKQKEPGADSEVQPGRVEAKVVVSPGQRRRPRKS
jgi:hypothetical protein